MYGSPQSARQMFGIRHLICTPCQLARFPWRSSAPTNFHAVLIARITRRANKDDHVCMLTKTARTSSANELSCLHHILVPIQHPHQPTRTPRQGFASRHRGVDRMCDPLSMFLTSLCWCRYSVARKWLVQVWIVHTRWLPLSLTFSGKRLRRSPPSPL